MRRLCMAMQIKPIETVYRGVRFRSRLEARWAVFFDTLGIPWEYEKEGYRVGSNRRAYLPDFWLPEQRSWVEVKGSVDALDFQLLAECVDWGMGLPDMEDSMFSDPGRGLLVLGPIPFVPDTPRTGPVVKWIPVHPILQHNKGGHLRLARFHFGGFAVLPDCNLGYFDSTWGAQSDTEDWVKALKEHFGGGLGGPGLAETKRAYEAARVYRFWG